MPAADLQGRWVVMAGLRAWAAGSVRDEAAVELLATLGARFTSSARPWIRSCPRPGWYWLDADALAGYVGLLTPHQERVLALVGALLTGHLRVQRATPSTSARVELGRAAA